MAQHLLLLLVVSAANVEGFMYSRPTSVAGRLATAPRLCGQQPIDRISLRRQPLFEGSDGCALLLCVSANVRSRMTLHVCECAFTHDTSYSPTHTPTESLNLLYDGKCSVCQWEVDNLKSLGADGRIAFTDIESQDFDASDPRNAGVTYAEAMAKITAVTQEGDILVGIPVFAACYEAVGLGWLFTATRMPLIGPLIDTGYKLFAAIRTDVTRGRRLRDLIAEHTIRSEAECASCRGGEGGTQGSNS